MTAVMGQFYAADAGIAARQLLYEIPGPIPAAVIDEHDAAVRCDALVCAQCCQQGDEAAGCFRQYFFFIEARHDDIQTWGRTLSSHMSYTVALQFRRARAAVCYWFGQKIART